MISLNSKTFNALKHKCVLSILVKGVKLGKGALRSRAENFENNSFWFVNEHRQRSGAMPPIFCGPTNTA